MAKRDYYDVLGISRSATPQDIRKAHRKLVREYHPDANRDDPANAAKFNEVQEAYHVLSDAEKRKRYDQFGHAGMGTNAAEPDPFGAKPGRGRGTRGGSNSGGWTSWQTSPGVTVEDFDISGGSVSDIFEQLFGGRRAAGASTGQRRTERATHDPSRGQDVEHEIELDFEQAARGTTLPLQIDRDGQVESIEVKIPAGVKDGSRVRIRGKGQQAPGLPGDLFIITRVKPHAYFRREGLDVLIDLPVSVYESLLGTRVTVPTLDGPVTVNVPAGTSSHAKLRIKGRGVEKAGERGDHFCVIKVVAPREVDADMKELVRKLQQKQPVNAREDQKW